MEAPAMRTSFDVVCAASLQRHFAIREMILKGLKKSRPQSDQMELELQSLSDEVTTKMDGWLLRQTEVSRQPRSAEFFAECWDYLLWDIYKVTYNVDEEFPFHFPEYNDSLAKPSAPEHLRILEPQKPEAPAPQIVAGPSSLPAPSLSAPQAKGDAELQDTMASMALGLGKLEIGQPQAAHSGLDPVWGKVLSEGMECKLTQSSPEQSSMFAPSKLSPLSPQGPPRQSLVLGMPKPSPPPSPTRLPPPPASMSNDQRRERYTSAVLTSDEATRDWRKRAADRVESAAQNAGMSKNDYASAAAVPINERFTLRSAEDQSVSTPEVTWAEEAEDSAQDSPSPTESTKPPKAEEPAKPEALVKSPEPAKPEPKPLGAQAVPPAPTLELPYKQAMENIPKAKPAQPTPLPKPVPPPKVKVGQQAPVQDKPVVRPVREDLPENRQERVLPLKVRQEIWDWHFEGCEMQKDAEPLQLQILRHKRDELLLGDWQDDGGRLVRVVFDRLKDYLPHDVDIVYQDASDKRFEFTLIYIGLKSAWKDDPHVYNSVLSLHLAWATLYPWAQLVNDRYNVNAAEFAKWHTNNEIEVRRHRTLSADHVMEQAYDWVKSSYVPRDPLVARSHPPAPRAPRPKPGQHQARVTAERRAENDQLSIMMEEAEQAQRAEVIALVPGIIDKTRTGKDPAGTALDWKALKTSLSQFAVKAGGDASSRAIWVHEGCTAWRKENLPENSEQQVLFDRELNSWYNNFLGFMGSKD